MGRRIDNSDRGALISVESVRRIAKAIAKVENGDRRIPAPPIRTAYEDETGVKIGRTAAAWPKGEVAELELIYQGDCEVEGGSGSGGNLLEAHNVVFDVASGVRVVVALAENGCWYLVQAESCDTDGSGSGCECPAIGGQDLTTLDNYDASKVQLLGHDMGCLRWFNVTECEEGSGSGEGSGS